MFLFVFWLRNRPSIKYIRKGTRKTPSKKIATRMIPTGQFAPRKFPPRKIPTQDSWTISHTSLPCLSSRCVSPESSITPYNWTDGGSAGVLYAWYGFSSMGSFGAILGNGYRIQGQNCVEIFREVKCKQGFATGIWY